MFCCGEVVSDSAAVLHCGPCAWLVTVLPWCIVVRVQLVLYLIENKMSSLSGRPQKIVVNILEEIVNQGAVLLTLKTTHVYRMICEIHWVRSSLAKTKV